MFSLSSLLPIEQLVDSDNLPDVAIFQGFVKKCEKRFFSSASWASVCKSDHTA